MNKKWKIVTGVVICLIVASVIIWRYRRVTEHFETVEQTSPVIGSIDSLISVTGTIQPQNRVEIKPTIAGRIEEILVEEGDKVEAGTTVAWMSSKERAALLDAARPQGKEALDHWKNVYKPTPLITPISGEVIVRAVEPGQSVTANDPVVVVSDRLIVRAQVDETDIGKINVGQAATITLDAYQDASVEATVDHIAYESKTVQNVVMYEVEVLPKKVPKYFRSGMSATVEILEKVTKGLLLIPHRAIQYDEDGSFVMVPTGSGMDRRPVQLGMSDENNIEVTSGLKEGEPVLIVKRVSSSSLDDAKSNPFMPFKRKKKDTKNSKSKRPGGKPRRSH